jgi:hypothetical protein
VHFNYGKIVKLNNSGFILDMSLCAYTKIGQLVQILPYEGGLIAIISGEFFLVDGSTLLHGDEKIPLYNNKNEPFTVANSETFNQSFYYESKKCLKVVTADPYGTKRFDDGQSISCKAIDLEGVAVKVLKVKIAVVRDLKANNGRGFVQGKQCSAYVFVYSYISINGKFVDKSLRCTITDVIAENHFFKTKIEDGRSVPSTCTSNMKDLANVISYIQPGSRYANPKLAIGFWMLCLSRNMTELCADLSIKGKFTAPLRDSSACKNLSMMNKHIHNLSALVL